MVSAVRARQGMARAAMCAVGPRGQAVPRKVGRLMLRAAPVP